MAMGSSNVQRPSPCDKGGNSLSLPASLFKPCFQLCLRLELGEHYRWVGLTVSMLFRSEEAPFCLVHFSNFGFVVLVLDFNGELSFLNRIFFAMLEGGQMGRAPQLCVISRHSISGICASRLCVLNLHLVDIMRAQYSHTL